MIGIEFGPPTIVRAQGVLARARNGQCRACSASMITIPLFRDHKILAQVAGHASHTVKLLPPLIITDEDCSWIEDPLSRRDRRHASGAGRHLVARQDAGGSRDQGARDRMSSKQKHLPSADTARLIISAATAYFTPMLRRSRSEFFRSTGFVTRGLAETFPGAGRLNSRKER